MRGRIIVLTSLAASLFSPSLCAAQGTRGFDQIGQRRTTGARRAVVVGISEYEHLKPLAFAARDARAFYDFLRAKPGGSLDTTRIKLLLDRDARGSAIYDALVWLIDTSEEGDEAIVYFAGHGDVERITSSTSGFLLGYDAPTTNYFARGGVQVTNIELLLNTLVEKGVRAVVITDACRDGKLVGTVAGARQTTAALLASWQGVSKLVSSQADQLSHEGPQWGGGHGVFTWYLLQGLAGLAVAEGDKSVPLSRLADYVQSNVMRETDSLQMPDRSGDPRVVLAAVDPETRRRAVARANIGTPSPQVTGNEGTRVATLPSRADTLADRALSRLYAAITAGRLLGPDSTAAWTIYQRWPDAAPANSKALARRVLLGALQDQGQTAIVDYLAGGNVAAPASRFRQAAEELRLARSLLGPNSVRAKGLEAQELFASGYALVLDGRAAEALPALRRSIALEPEAAYAYNALGIALAAQHEDSAAERAFGDALQRAPRWTYPLTELGRLFEKQGKREAAAGKYSEALGADSNFARARLGLGWLQLSGGQQRSLALGHMRRALDIRREVADTTGMAEALDELARAHIMWGGSAVVGLGYVQQLAALHDSAARDDSGLEGYAYTRLGAHRRAFELRYGTTRFIGPSDRYLWWYDDARTTALTEPGVDVLLRDSATVELHDAAGGIWIQEDHPISGKPVRRQAGAAWMRAEYDSIGENLLRVTSSRHNEVRLTYDDHARIDSLLLSEPGGARRVLHFVYNDSGKPTRISVSGVGEIDVTYRSDGVSVDSVRSPQGHKVALEVTTAFQQLLDLIRVPTEQYRSAGELIEQLTGERQRSRPSSSPSRPPPLPVYDLVTDDAAALTYVARGSDIAVVRHREVGRGAIAFDSIEASHLALDSQGRLLANDGLRIVRYPRAGSSAKLLFDATSTVTGDFAARRIGNILVASDGTVWVAAGSSLFRWRDDMPAGKAEEFSFFIDSARFPARSELSSRVIETVSGRIWVIASDEGHLRYNGQPLVGGVLEWTGTQFRRLDVSRKTDAWFLTGYTRIDDSTAIAGSVGGFVRHQGDRLAALAGGPDGSYANLEAAHARLWLGTNGAKAGDTWIFGSADGVIAYRNGQWWYPDRLNDKLPDDDLRRWGSRTVHAVATDRAGRVYVGTDRGLLISADGPASLRAR
jgi:tetratricopeptide (TPR) repeat protein/uncharacterized caspase-like protein